MGMGWNGEGLGFAVVGVELNNEGCWFVIVGEGLFC